MQTDIIVGLGDVALHLEGTDYADTVNDAAAEIERLRAALAEFIHFDELGRPYQNRFSDVEKYAYLLQRKQS